MELASFASGSGFTDSSRSLLYLEQARERGREILRSWSGPAGIERYLEAENKGRLIQSLKSFLSSRTLLATEVFGRSRRLEELIARILSDLRAAAEAQFGVRIGSIVAGRPVRFVGAENADDDAFAEGRLREAFRIAGFEDVAFTPEPVAAASYYDSTGAGGGLILIGDFGGGTSDFSLIRGGSLLGNGGVGVAGDAFDAKIVRHLVSPALGAGSGIRSFDKILPAPTWPYAKAEKWHHLSFLKSKDTLNMLRTVQAQSLEPEKIGALRHLINEDLGYQLHRAVQAAKCELSTQPSAVFRFSDGVVDLEQPVRRVDFEAWIRDELRQLSGCIDDLLHRCGVRHGEVEQVFLTGGTSFVPSVRRIFEARFGAGRIRAGNEFTAVARGLGLQAYRAAQ